MLFLFAVGTLNENVALLLIVPFFLYTVTILATLSPLLHFEFCLVDVRVGLFHLG